MTDILKVIYFLLLDYFIVFLKHTRSLVSKPPESWQKGERGNVIVVQGLSETWFFFKKLSNFLNKRGFKVFVIKELDYNFLPVAKCVEILEKFIVQNKLSNVIMLAHSKGGKITKYFLDSSTFADKVQSCINIATPYQGTVISHLGGRSLTELNPKSDFIKILNHKNENNHKILNLYPKVDNYVVPNTSLILEGAINVCIDVIGHVRILDSDRTLLEIKSFLELHTSEVE